MSELSMQEVLKRNKEYMQWKNEMRKKELKREKRRNRIAFTICVVIILGYTINALMRLNKENMDNCMKKGYSQNICEMVAE